jgi:hypothetical protein
MQTRMFISPAGETVELAFAVKRMHTLAVEVLFFHLPDDADGLLPHGPEPFDQLIQCKPIVFPCMG